MDICIARLQPAFPPLSAVGLTRQMQALGYSAGQTAAFLRQLYVHGHITDPMRAVGAVDSVPFDHAVAVPAILSTIAHNASLGGLSLAMPGGIAISMTFFQDVDQSRHGAIMPCARSDTSMGMPLASLPQGTQTLYWVIADAFLSTALLPVTAPPDGGLYPTVEYGGC